MTQNDDGEMGVMMMKKVQVVVGEEWVDDDDGYGDKKDSICCCGVVVDVKRENLLKNSSIVLSCGSFVFVFPPVNFCFFFDTVTDVRTVVLIIDYSISIFFVSLITLFVVLWVFGYFIITHPQQTFL